MREWPDVPRGPKVAQIQPVKGKAEAAAANTRGQEQKSQGRGKGEGGVKNRFPPILDENPHHQENIILNASNAV